MTIRPFIVAAVTALALGLGGMALASAHEMGDGERLRMHQRAAQYGDDDWSCPRVDMMGRGMMDRGMMDDGMGKAMGPGAGMMGRGHVGFPTLLSADEVKMRFETMIAGNKRLKVSKVEPGGDFSFKVEITTQEGAVVHNLLVDRRSGMAWEVE